MHKFAEKIMECVKSKVESRGIDNVSYDEVKELGEWVDIAKDIVCYDKDMRIIEAMDEEDKYDDADYRMGYRGRDSKGRFVHRPGRGRSAGYTPYIHMIPPFMDGMYDEYDGMMPEDYRMGYSEGRGGRSGNYGNSGNSDNYGNNVGQESNSGRYGYSEGNRNSSRYGESYDDYRKARRHYTELGDEQSKKRMQDSVSDVFDDMEDIVNDVVKSMDTSEKAAYRQKLTQMVQKMQ